MTKEAVPENALAPHSSADDGRRVSIIERRRLSGPAFRTFAAIADLWDLSLKERMAVLGHPSRSAYFRWRRMARDDQPFAMGVGVLTLISHIFIIHGSVQVLVGTQSEATLWLRQPHQAPQFAGQRPIDHLVSGSLEGILLVRRFLEGACEGLYMSPNVIDVDFVPYTDDEILLGS